MEHRADAVRSWRSLSEDNSRHGEARPQAGQGLSCFPGHSSQDDWIAAMMKEKIEERGIAVWLDTCDLPGGASLRDRIKEGIEGSHECLVLLSPASLES